MEGVEAVEGGHGIQRLSRLCGIVVLAVHGVSRGGWRSGQGLEPLLVSIISMNKSTIERKRGWQTGPPI